MTHTFYIAAAVALVATAMVVLRTRPVHSLLYLVVSLLATAVMMFALGSPLAAALEVILYAGAIVVLLVFVIMLLNLSTPARTSVSAIRWIGPGLLSGVLLVQVIWAMGSGAHTAPQAISPRGVGLVLFTEYALVVELASMLLLAALVGAFHLARPHAGNQPGEGA
jgi:NADH-quinone oxidoreductase subunit J